MMSAGTSGTKRASARSTPWAAMNLAMALRFTSAVRPDRISSPITRAAAVTRSGAAVALIGCVPYLGSSDGLSRRPMDFPQPLARARLIQRYKRFLADVVLEETGETVTIHVPNPGAMLGLNTPGMDVWVSRSASPTR